MQKELANRFIVTRSTFAREYYLPFPPLYTRIPWEQRPIVPPELALCLARQQAEHVLRFALISTQNWSATQAVRRARYCLGTQLDRRGRHCLGTQLDRQHGL